jgi:23S rRNA pseudouridine2457 synthase
MASPRILALNKPFGVLSRFTPHDGHPGLATLLHAPGLRPVGRLDLDSEGLLLLTDDGALAHALTDPRHAHPRTYWVQVEGRPGPDALRALSEGVVVEGRRTRPARVQALAQPPALPERPVPIRFRKHVPTAWLALTLFEGRNRQVRRMTAAVGHPTLRLVRVGIGPLELARLGLAPGAWRDLDPAEARALRAAVAARVSDDPRATRPPAPRHRVRSGRAPRGS